MNQGALYGHWEASKEEVTVFTQERNGKAWIQKEHWREQRRETLGFQKMGETVIWEVILFQFHWTEWGACHWSATSGRNGDYKLNPCTTPACAMPMASVKQCKAILRDPGVTTPSF